MFVVGSHAALKVNIKLPNNEVQIPILIDAEVKIIFNRREYQFTKEVLITNQIIGEGICYLEPEDLKLPGNYEYQIVVNYYKENRIVKSPINSFFVHPGIHNKER